MRKITILLLQLVIAIISLLALAFTVPASDGLPPRPNTPTPVPPSSTPSAPQPLSGALIILQQSEMDPFPAEAWTVVQWQNDAGRWYDVEGWQSTFDSNDRVVWWVSHDDLGDGPFRWQVYDSPARDKLLATTSEIFDLPTHSGQRLIIEPQLP